MSTENKPLLSDEKIRTIAEYVSGSNANEGIRHERKQAAESALYLFRDHCDTYEADRAKTREVVQRLVDALWLALSHLTESETVTLEYVPPADGLRRAADAMEKRAADIRAIVSILDEYTTKPVEP